MGGRDAAVTSTRAVWAQRIGVAIVWVAAILVWRNHQTTNDLSTTGAGQRFLDAIGSSWWGALAYVGVYLIRPIVLFPASVLTVMGGILFGAWIGVLVVVVAANASAMVAYGVGRLLGSRPAESCEADPAADVQRSFIATWSLRLRENSFETVFVMRLLFLPYDLVSYACGALRIRWAPFLLATALGSLPGTVSFVLLGASLERIDQGIDGINPWAVVASVAIFVVSIVISRALRKRHT